MHNSTYRCSKKNRASRLSAQPASVAGLDIISASVAKLQVLSEDSLAQLQSATLRRYFWAWLKQLRFWVRRGGLICGSIVGGSLKSEGFGDG